MTTGKRPPRKWTQITPGGLVVTSFDHRKTAKELAVYDADDFLGADDIEDPYADPIEGDPGHDW